jgi:hypothetical protein
MAESRVSAGFSPHHLIPHQMLQACKVAEMAGSAVLTSCQQAQDKHENECRGMRLIVATGVKRQSPSRVDINGVERVVGC